jgi:hypothetical protein
MHVTFYILSFFGIKKPEFTPEEVDQYPEVPIDPMPQDKPLEIAKSPKGETAAIDESEKETSSDDQPVENINDFESFDG